LPGTQYTFVLKPNNLMEKTILKLKSVILIVFRPAEKALLAHHWLKEEPRCLSLKHSH